MRLTAEAIESAGVERPTEPANLGRSERAQRDRERAARDQEVAWWKEKWSSQEGVSKDEWKKKHRMILLDECQWSSINALNLDPGAVSKEREVFLRSMTVTYEIGAPQGRRGRSDREQ